MRSFVHFFSFLLLSSCTSFFFRPDDKLHRRPELEKLIYRDITIEGSDGVRLHGWLFQNKQNLKKPEGLVVQFHGNTQNVSSHYRQAAWLSHYGYDVLVWDYRGYGKSGGEAEGEEVWQDTQEVLDYAYQHYLKKNHQQFILMGQSMGGGLLLWAYDKFPKKKKIDLIILEGAFLSYRQIVLEKMQKPWWKKLISPLAYLVVTDKYSAKKRVHRIMAPTLVIHGSRDQRVPLRFGREVYQKLGTPTKWFWEVPEGIHLDTFTSHDDLYRQKLLQFLNRL